LLDSPILYLSPYIIQNKAAYYGLMQDTARDQDRARRILLRLHGVEKVCTWTRWPPTEYCRAVDRFRHFIANGVSRNIESSDACSG